jgi:hypothetical protein
MPHPYIIADTALLRRATMRIIEYRFKMQNERMARREDMDRLAAKLERAAGVVGRITAKLEDKADFVIAREDAIDKRGERLFDAKHAVLDAADAGLDKIEAQLARLSNDPLPVSTSSQEAADEPADQFPAAAPV